MRLLGRDVDLTAADASTAEIWTALGSPECQREAVGLGVQNAHLDHLGRLAGIDFGTNCPSDGSCASSSTARIRQRTVGIPPS